MMPCGERVGEGQELKLGIQLGGCSRLEIQQNTKSLPSWIFYFSQVTQLTDKQIILASTKFHA